jgi:hypothetical protein
LNESETISAFKQERVKRAGDSVLG